MVVFLLRYTCCIILLGAYLCLTKNTFRNMYRMLKRFTTLRSSRSLHIYQPVNIHWFYKTESEGRTLWKTFSTLDSNALENAFASADMSTHKIISTDGGRYDVNLFERQRNSVYWTATPLEVRRCSWFHKGNNENYFTPFEENIAEILEYEYRIAYEGNDWYHVTVLPNGDSVSFNGPDVLLLLSPEMHRRLRTIKRGVDEEFDIEDDESPHIEHLIFAIHGIGSICDLKFRTIEEVVNVFRKKLQKLIKLNHGTMQNRINNNRIEVLPLNWHTTLHSERTQVDSKVQNVTLESMPLIRNFTNDTLLDVLLYTSPIYYQDADTDDLDGSSPSLFTRVPFSQVILNTVGNELNRLYKLFKERNKAFHGQVSLMGHSLGSVILFDLLHNQEEESKTNSKVNLKDMCKRICQPHLQYPHLNFQPVGMFALGSPIGMFLTVRGIDRLGPDFCLPTCPHLFNIFHPCDPVAYRIEPLVNPEFQNFKPALIPRTSRKHMHLEIKEAMVRVGTSIKEKINSSHSNRREESTNTQPSFEVRDENENVDYRLGNLNKGRRIDYALEDNAIDFFKEYVCGLTSHACYWESEDVILMILEQLYLFGR